LGLGPRILHLQAQILLENRSVSNSVHIYESVYLVQLKIMWRLRAT
jgi:hypothetical protein